MDNDAAAPILDQETRDALIDDFYRKYVHMVLYARKGAGSWSDNDQLSSFTVYLRDSAVICINDAPEGWSIARTRRSFEPGEQLEVGDVISDQVPRPTHLAAVLQCSPNAERLARR